MVRSKTASKTLGACLVGLFSICMVGPGALRVSPAHAAEAPSRRLTGVAALEVEKAEAETRKATVEREKLEGDQGTFWRLAPDLAPILTAMIAGIGLFVTAKKAGEDRSSTLEKERKDREDTREAAEIERFDERFANAVKGVSSSHPDEQRGAAVLITSMVREKREALSDQALQLLLVVLQSEHDSTCEKILTLALARFARAAPARLLATENGVPIFGLARVKAAEIDLSRLALPGLDLAFANLSGADFREANLEGSKALRADLSDARFSHAVLSSVRWVEVVAPRAKFQNAKMERAGLFRADLNKANFYRAELQRANLRHSKLEGARFERAEIGGADFYGATFDDGALRSILKANGHEAAVFDLETADRLMEMK